jgi:hypothetical protein
MEGRLMNEMIEGIILGCVSESKTRAGLLGLVGVYLKLLTKYVVHR